MIDLHMHSIYSDDGELTPEQLVGRCAQEGVTVLAITDHNCVRGYEEGAEAAGKYAVRVLPGIEIDCVWEKINFHLLGYGIDWTGEDFARIEKNIADQSAAASLEMLARTRKLGFEVTEDDMRKVSEHSYWKDRWTGEMFGEVLLRKEEYRAHPLLEAYRPGGARGDNPYVNFYWDFYSQGKPCHVGIRYPRMEDMIEVVHKNGGIAVLAHPGANLRGKEEKLTEILDLGIDGVEVFSSYHSGEQTAYFYDRTKAAGLGMTCGSDFHGKTKPAVKIGRVCDESRWDRETIEQEVRRFLDPCITQKDLKGRP